MSGPTRRPTPATRQSRELVTYTDESEKKGQILARRVAFLFNLAKFCVSDTICFGKGPCRSRALVEGAPGVSAPESKRRSRGNDRPQQGPDSRFFVTPFTFSIKAAEFLLCQWAFFRSFRP